MPTATLNDGTTVQCLVRSETLVLDHHVRGYFNHGIEVRDGDIVFDVGANIGIFALRALERGPSVRVFAFEPVPDIYAVLARNSALHGEGRLMALPYGVSRRWGRHASITTRTARPSRPRTPTCGTPIPLCSRGRCAAAPGTPRPSSGRHGSSQDS